MIDRPALIAWRSKAPWPDHRAALFRRPRLRTLDSVRHQALTEALARIAAEIGPTVSGRQRSGQMVHVHLDGEPTEGIGRIRIKVEINIAETKPFQPPKVVHHAVETSWWSGEADIPTFQPEELLATKLRALYQRSATNLVMRELGSRLRNAPPVEEIAPMRS